MPAAGCKSDAEHYQFLRELSELKVRFALRWVADDPGTSLPEALAQRTFLVNLTPWHDGAVFDYAPEHPADEPAWEAFLAAAGAAESAEAILALLPDPAPRVARDQAELHDPQAGLAAQPSPFRWGEHEVMELPAGAPLTMGFHIANNAYPHSFLADREAVHRAIRELALTAREKGFAAVGTFSWLNENPAWLTHFPPAFANHICLDGEVGPHLGTWGQLLTARQTLNHKLARQLLETGRFPYRLRATWAPIDEVLEFVG
ncbi:MAG: hypothetical protein ACOYEV_15780 [Candidatus Nanopelagicales bacterium]